MKKLKVKDRDLWYKKMGDRLPIKPEDEPVVGLMGVGWIYFRKMIHQLVKIINKIVLE